MPANEQLQEFGKKLLKRADLVGIGVLMLLLLTTLFFFWQETNYTAPPVTPPPPAEFVKQIPSDPYTKVQKLYMQAQTDIRKDPKSVRLVENNMFDLKTLREAGELAAKVKEPLAQAERLFGENKLEEAKKAIGDVLKVYPTYPKALDLQERILKALSTPTPTATPAPKE